MKEIYDLKERILSILAFVFSEADALSKYYDKENVDKQYIFLFCLYNLDRLRSSCKGLKALVDQLPENQELEFSCGLIIRAIVLDFMAIVVALDLVNEGYILEPVISEVDAATEQGNRPLTLEKFCASMLSDSPVKLVDEIEMSSGRVSKDTIETLYKDVVSHFPDAFMPYAGDGSKPVAKYKGGYSGTKLYRKIQGSIVVRSEASVFEVYSIYSKYDHFGYVYYHTSRRSFLQKMEHMFAGTQIFATSLLYILAILYSGALEDQIIIRAKERSEKFILEMKANHQAYKNRKKF
jgi:hypothetical protein